MRNQMVSPVTVFADSESARPGRCNFRNPGGKFRNRRILFFIPSVPNTVKTAPGQNGMQVAKAMGEIILRKDAQQ